MIDLLAGLLLQAAILPDDAGVACILGRLDGATRAAIAAETAAEEDAPSHPGTDALDRAVDRCAQAGHWASGATGDRAGVATALILRDGAVEVLARAGIAPAQIEAALDRLGPRARIAMPTDAEGARLFDDLARRGIAADVLDRNAEIIGQYIGALIVLTRVARGLPVGG